MFLDSMKTRIRGKNHRVLYADGKEESVLKAAAILRDEGLATPVVMSDPEELNKMAQKLNIDLKGIDIHDPKDDKNFDQYVHEYCELRKHKGMTEKEAEKLMGKPHFFGAMMVHMGAADGMVSGLSGDTKPFIPAFQIVGLRDGFKRASSVFVLEWPERLLFFADCSVNIDPDAQGLAEIAYATVETVRWLGVEPRVAFLSFSTHGSAKDPSLDKIKEAKAIAMKEMPHAIIDGEIQFDAALLPEVARIKTPDSPLREQGANVFIFPDLNSGNIAYKISERLGRARATGPMLQGLKKPINDVSRGCSVEDLANAGVLTAALAKLDD
ncbi:phosphate acetyltransferase [soil metagenome]